MSEELAGEGQAFGEPLPPDELEKLADDPEQHAESALLWWARYAAGGGLLLALGLWGKAAAADVGAVYDRVNRVWRTASGGWVEAALISEELGEHQRQLAATLRVLTGQLYAGTANLAEWQAAVAGELRDAHVAHAVFGRGGRERMTSKAWGRVGGHLKDEYRWLGEFAQGIADGQVSLAQAQSRAAQYARATQQAYHREWAYEQDRPAWAGLPPLNQVPRDGRTQCRGNCKCNLVSTPQGLVWEMSPAEHCDDCRALAAGGPYRPGRL
jgi:hypothetical protein